MKTNLEMDFEDTPIWNDLDEIARKIEFHFDKPGVEDFVEIFDALVKAWKNTNIEVEQ